MKRWLVVFPIIFWLAVYPANAGVMAQEATESAETVIATEAAERKIQQATEADITERTSPVKSKLERYLAEKDPGELNWNNFLQHSIRQAVSQGVSPNTIVLVLLFPLAAGLIAAARHLLGFAGFGIFLPAMLSVAFLATGVKVGLSLLVITWLAATLFRQVTKRLKLQYLPRLAFLMWFVSLGVLAALLGAVNLEPLSSLSAASIFPILILMLLTENFIEVQTGKSRREAVNIVGQTLILAMGLALVMRADQVQRFVLLNPELTLALTAAFDIYVGKYVGLRALEWVKYRKLWQN